MRPPESASLPLPDGNQHYWLSLCRVRPPGRGRPRQRLLPEGQRAWARGRPQRTVALTVTPAAGSLSAVARHDSPPTLRDYRRAGRSPKTRRNNPSVAFLGFAVPNVSCPCLIRCWLRLQFWALLGLPPPTALQLLVLAPPPVSSPSLGPNCLDAVTTSSCGFARKLHPALPASALRLALFGPLSLATSAVRFQPGFLSASPTAG